MFMFVIWCYLISVLLDNLFWHFWSGYGQIGNISQETLWLDYHQITNEF